MAPLPAPDHLKTYGLRRLYVAPYDPTHAYADTDLVRVPGIQTCSVTLTNDAAELRGDNRVISVVDQGNGGEFSLAQGGIDLAAAAVIFGGTVIEETEGTDPDDFEVRTLRIGANDERPYFTLIGDTYDDGEGGGAHVVLWKCKAAGNVELSLADQEFLVPSVSGRFIGRDGDDTMIDFQQYAVRVDPADEGIREPVETP